MLWSAVQDVQLMLMTPAEAANSQYVVPICKYLEFDYFQSKKY